MKKILLLLAIIPNIILAQSPEELVHNSRLYVDDYANVFTDQQEQQLDKTIRMFFDTVQISIVTINSFGQITPGDYAVRLGRRWGVGGQSNNGLLIILGIKDRHIEVSTGMGIEGDLPDVMVVELQKELAVPEFKKQNYFGGTMALLNAYINKMSPSAKALRIKEDAAQKIKNEQQWEKTKNTLLIILLILSVASLLALPFYIKWRKNKKIKRESFEEAERKERLLYVAPLYSGAALSAGQKSYDNDSPAYNSSPYTSNNDYNSSSSSSPDTGSSSSDFGGGSFSGGGGGSDW